MDAQWLQTQFKVHPDKTKAGLAEAVGLEPSAISKILKGARQIKAQEYFNMRNYFGLPNDGEPVRKNYGPSYSIKSEARNFADGESPPDDWIMPAAIYSPRTDAPTENIRIFEVKETFMEPDFRRGDYVLADLSEKNAESPGLFVISDGFSHMLRHCELVKKTKAEKIKVSASRNFEPQLLSPTDFLIIGRVVGKLDII
jgi:transcriptional regulator with XRE-family HTH domain